MPQVTREEAIKKNVLDNSVRPSDNEICNTTRQECNDTELLKTTRDIYVEGKINGRNVRFLVVSRAVDIFNHTKAVSLTFTLRMKRALIRNV